MYLYVLVLFLIVVTIIVKRCNAFDILKPTLWFYISYSFLFLTHVFSGFKYTFGSLLHILPYVIICLTLFLIGYYIKYTVKSRIIKDFVSIKLSTIVKLSIVGGFLTAFDFFRLNTISIGMRIDDQQLSILGIVGNALACLGIIVWLYSLHDYLLGNGRISFYSYLSLICYVIYDILAGGRQSIFMIAISSFIMILWCVKKRKELPSTFYRNAIKKHFPWFGLVIILFFCGYFFIISLFRSQISDIDNKIAMFEDNMTILSKDSKDFVHKLGPFADIYVEEMFYYSHEFHRLDVLFNNYDFPPLLGVGQFPYIARRFEWIIGDVKDQSWAAQEKALGTISAHTWGTILCDYIIDYGRFGSLFAFLLTGLIVGNLTNNSKNSQNMLLIIRQCIVCTGIIFSIQFSPFMEMSWFVPLVFTSFIGVTVNSSKIKLNET